MPAAICPFQGRVLIGVGRLLRIYDMGKKKLLRKCENKVSLDQGNLKGESVVAAILLSHMQVSYCTSGFFGS